MRDDDKFVTTLPTDQILVAEYFQQALGNFLEQDVTIGMPMAVVDILEIIQIDEKHRKRRCSAPYPMRFRQSQILAILEAGKEILAGLLQQFVMAFLLILRDLTEHQVGKTENDHKGKR